MADFLEAGRELAVAEGGTVTWYAFKINETSYGIFDTFASDDAGQRTSTARFSDAASRRDFGAFGDLFADGGIWEIGEPCLSRAAGRQNVVTMLRNLFHVGAARAGRGRRPYREHWARRRCPRRAVWRDPSWPDRLGSAVEARRRALLSYGEAADRLYREAIDRLGRTGMRSELPAEQTMAASRCTTEGTVMGSDETLPSGGPDAASWSLALALAAGIVASIGCRSHSRVKAKWTLAG